MGSEMCIRDRQNKKFQDHVFHLLVHSTLHLLGFVHKLELDANIMEKIEVEILAKASISDPYRIHYHCL